MSVFVSEFAAQRGMTVQGVYKAIKRHNIPTQQGVSNGKSAQFMTDEDAARLNELLGPTESSNLILKQNLELQIRTEREDLLKETSSKVEATLREKADEVEKTRAMMLDRIDNGVSEMKQIAEEERAGTMKLYQSQIKDQKKEIEELKGKIDTLTTENQELKERINQLEGMLVEAVNHPYAHLINCASHIDDYKPFERGKKSGKSAKDN